MTRSSSDAGTGMVGVLAGVLRDNGISDDAASTFHSWRCAYPDLYGPCGCFAELLAELAAALGERGNQ